MSFVSSTERENRLHFFWVEGWSVGYLTHMALLEELHVKKLLPLAVCALCLDLHSQSLKRDSIYFKLQNLCHFSLIFFRTKLTKMDLVLFFSFRAYSIPWPLSRRSTSSSIGIDWGHEAWVYSQLLHYNYPYKGMSIFICYWPGTVHIWSNTSSCFRHIGDK